MYILFIIIAIICSLLMIVAVLLQKSKKEGGIDPLATESTKLIGITKTTDLLGRVTWSLAFIITVSAVISSYYIKKKITGGTFYSPNVKAAQTKDLLKDSIKMENDKIESKNLSVPNSVSNKGKDTEVAKKIQPRPLNTKKRDGHMKPSRRRLLHKRHSQKRAKR